VNEERQSGTYREVFNAAQLPAGMYFAHLESGGASETIKMIYSK
jgi:hypothetical protein